MVVLAQSRNSDIDHLAVRLENADLAAVLEHLDGDTVGLLRLRVEQRDIGNVDWHVLVDDPTGLPLHRVGSLVLLHPVHALYHDVVLVDAAQHDAALALVPACDDDDVVTFSNSLHVQRSLQHLCYKTSGASDTIFMKRSVRSSRVTGPMMRVPMGSSLGVSSTAALESKRISDPSGRRTPLAVRTT